MQKQLQFPLIGKPDIGMQGKAVKKLLTIDGLTGVCLHSKVDFLVQEFVPYENEVGIFYYRYPDRSERKYIRYCCQRISCYYRRWDIKHGNIACKKKKDIFFNCRCITKNLRRRVKNCFETGRRIFLLVPYGNHVRGAKFIDASHLIDEELTRTIDHVCQQVNGFYFGRLDIRYQSWEELKQGKNFSIIELNGAGSEPTHMYDPKHSIFFAWKEIIRHWNILARISRINHRLLKKPYMNISAGLEMLKANKRYVKLINSELQAAGLIVINFL